MNREAHSRELLGYERSLVVDEHVRWLAGRMPSEVLREADLDARDSAAPIAVWSRGHRLAAAQRRSRLNGNDARNRKRFDRRDTRVPLVDEVT